jgi:GGDEF domain-containing protein
VEAVEALRSMLWERLMDELRSPPPRLVADMADRLGYVCSRALAVALAAIAPASDTSLGDGEEGRAETDRGEYESGSAEPVPLNAVIVDEREAIELAVARAPSSDDAERPLSWDESPPIPPAAAAGAGGRPLSWDESPPVPPSGAREEIEIRDERGEEGPAAWIGSIGHQLARFREDGLPFAVLLVELLEIERLRAEESTAELAQLAARVQDAITEELRAARPGSVTCESPGRYWLLALETDRSDAEQLAERLARTVASSVHHRQVPVAVVVGTAICPVDGLLAPMLAAHADVGLYAARSAARSMSGRPAGS